MSFTELIEPTPISELTSADHVNRVALVHEATLRKTREGSSFLRLRVGDRSGTIAAVIWDVASAAVDAAQPGAPVVIHGRYVEHPRYGRQLTLARLESANPDEVDWNALLDGPVQPHEELEAGLDGLIEGLQDPALQALMSSLLGSTTSIGRRFRCAPAAKYNHHAYRCGLLEHSLAVAQSVSAVAKATPAVDRDVAVCGALLHDIGKLAAYTDDRPVADLADAGRLQGEIPLGYYTVRRAIEDLPGFPPRIAEALLHIILSHHGCLEFGSPVVPATREALIVHAMDNLSGQLGSFDRLEKEAAAGERWSRYDNALGRSVMLAD